MEQYFPIMTDQYRRKHYKKGVFNRIHKNTAKVSFLTYIFMGVVLVASAYGTWWSLKKMDDFRANDLTAFGFVMTGVCALFAVIALACLIISARRHFRGPEALKAYCAEKNGYTVMDMNNFEQQALKEESRVVCLLNVAAKKLFGQEDGILTRDYIVVALDDPTIMRLEDVSTACILKQTLKMGQGANRTGVDYLSVGLMTKQGNSVVTMCTKESGFALLDLLKERIPNLDTVDGRILESNEYDELWASKYGKNNRFKKKKG